LGYATLFGTALTYGIFFYLAATGNLTSVSALIFLTPVFAMLFSYFFLSEVLSSLQWIGVVLTLISVVLVIRREEIGRWVASLSAKLDAASGSVLAEASEPLPVDRTPID